MECITKTPVSTICPQPQQMQQKHTQNENGTKKKENPKQFFLDFVQKMFQNGSRKEGGESPIF